MKNLILFFVLAASTSAFASSSITLDPGSSALVEAGESTRVTCSGSSSGAAGSPECTIVAAHEKDKYGNGCNYTGGYCAYFYKYGQAISWIGGENISTATDFCDRKMKP